MLSESERESANERRDDNNGMDRKRTEIRENETRAGEQKNGPILLKATLNRLLVHILPCAHHNTNHSKLFDINFDYLHIYGIQLCASHSTSSSFFLPLCTPANKMHIVQHNEQLVLRCIPYALCTEHGKCCCALHLSHWILLITLSI